MPRIARATPATRSSPIAQIVTACSAGKSGEMSVSGRPSRVNPSRCARLAATEM